MIAMQEIKRKQLLARKWHALIEEDARRVQEAKLGALAPTGEMDRASGQLRETRPARYVVAYPFVLAVLRQRARAVPISHRRLLAGSSGALSKQKAADLG